MIVKSLLDTDLYKLSMMQAVFHQCSGTEVEYQFKLRNKNINLAPFAAKIREEIEALCQLEFTDDELNYLSKLRFLKSDFIELLRIFRLKKRYVQVEDSSGDELSIRIVGPWLNTILFEVPILAIVNEVYFASKGETNDGNLSIGRDRLEQKIDVALEYGEKNPWLTKNGTPFLITDFGTRRRFSGDWQNYVVGRLKQHLPDFFIGTSNVLLAKNHELTPIGTMAHEWLQAPQGFDGVQLGSSQRFALQKWADEYRGDLGIALSDVVGFDAFLRDFDYYFAKLFDGCRHDSGDPAKWCRKLIEHYRSMKIDPKGKRAVFSDGLTIPKAIELHQEFKDQIGMGFGIGTNLTNDIGYEPLQIVIKLTKVNGKPVAKVSDARGKTMCEDQEFLNYLKKTFKISV